MSLPRPDPAPVPSPKSSRWWTIPVAWWWRSLPLRVIASVFLASVLVLVLGGFLLMQQASLGVMEGKKESVRNESRQALYSAQQQLNAADPTGGANVDKLLTDLAFGYANRTGGTEQFEVIIVAGGQTITAGEADLDSVPTALREQVAVSNDLLMTPTEVVYRDGSPSVPGLVTGSQLTLPGTGRYEIYFVFPLNQEVDTLRFLRSAAGTTGAILVILLTFIAALVARQVVTPVRAARRAAESLASGNLDDRMQVKGQDDLARLAASMNYMASELQKQITQLEYLSNIQQQFVSDVSHELRTPLTTVRMAAEVLYEGRDEFDPIEARSAELLQNELDRFEALLADLLEISRFDAGAAVLSPSKADLVQIVQQVVADHAHFAQRAGAEVVVHAPGPCEAEVDVRRIERILRNLLVNAIEHSEGKPIDVLVDADDDAVAIAVRDHGVGFEAGQARQVFHRFWRADPARARTMGGTGLGLAIAMEDANLHHGWLTAWGRPGLGAQFRLTVPRKAGGILQQSPLPLVPRDIIGLNARLGGTESALNGSAPAGRAAPLAQGTPESADAGAPAGPPSASGGGR
jgi:two-component system, OmpR family, sensor histidine kinase MtrB